MQAHKGHQQVAEETAEELLAHFRQMLTIRRFEEKAGQLYGMGAIGGFCHLSIGQEAVVVGLQSVARDGDLVIANHRAHAAMLACGMAPDAVMAELLGRRGGASAGKGGSLHMAAPSLGFYGGHGIIGAHVPIGAGLAFACRYRGSGGVAIVYLGDAALDQGQVAETFRLAALWKLPILFAVENNALGAETEAGADPPLYRRAEASGIEGRPVEGWDVLTVADAGAAALAEVRAGQGAKLLEIRTHRYRGHAMADRDKPKTRDEMARWRTTRDPVERMRRRLIEDGLADEAELRELDGEIRTTIRHAAEAAGKSPEPGPEMLTADIHPRPVLP